MDCLNFARQLKEKNIAVFFEKENVNTLDSKGDFMLSLLGSLAQEESNSISQATTQGIVYRFQEGKVRVNHKRFLGYTKDDAGELVIVPEEAEVVRRIYEKYMGDALLQKTYTVDFLSKKRVINKDHAQQYYVEDSHPAIISKEMFAAVQAEFARRSNLRGYSKTGKSAYTSSYPFSGKLFCHSCGSKFTRRTSGTGVFKTGVEVKEILS